MIPNNSQDSSRPHSILVIFGASGDLTRRKLIPALFGLEQEDLLNDSLAIVGFGRSEMTTDEFRRDMLAAISEFGPANPLESKLPRFAERLHYVAGQYDDRESLIHLHRFLGEIAARHGATRYLYYMALPPEVSERLLHALCGINRDELYPNKARRAIMMEKPFGMDLPSAQRLNNLLHEMFDEAEIYRIDHYIAKETVRNLLVFRFGNAIFEPLWNENHIDNVQITAAETIGIEGRGSYYDGVGIVRDIVQNHVMQVLSLMAMEPPVAGDAESVRDKKSEIFKSLETVRESDFIFGQYENYRQEKNVAADSTTPTFVALRLFINNWRWRGVPFYIRAGKALAERVTEVLIQFKSVPVCVFEDPANCALLRPNVLVLRIQPDEGIRLSFSAKTPGRDDSVTNANLDFRYADLSGRLTDAYERVILDSLRQKSTLFWRSESIEAAWRIVAPMLEMPAKDNPGACQIYAPGSWGPESANELLARDGRYWLDVY